jgi:hypothetical protein
MPSTPFIKPIPNSKGILYTMQSALNDMSTVFSQDNKRFRMSKFALVNIPSFEVPNVDGTNTSQVNSTGDDFIYNNTPVYNNNMVKYLAESFQNYCLNFEALLLSDPSFDTSEQRTVAERVFWKWMKEMGAMRYRQANSLELDTSVLPDAVRFVEEDEIIGLTYSYNRAIKYIADIEVVNSVQNKNAYTEFYIYIPTQVGSSPYVLFNSIVDSSNYKMTSPLDYPGLDPLLVPNTAYQNVTASSLDEPYLVGRHYDDDGVHPYSLDIHAAYDYSHDDNYVLWEVSGFDPPFGGAAIPMNPGYWFYDQDISAYAYYTDNSVESGYGTVIGDCRNRKVKRTRINPTGTSVSFMRSQLDGIVVDFDKTHYKAMNENAAIHTFADFNEINGSLDFSYNAILLYYELYDPANPDAPSITNLFGVQFLSKPIQTGTYWKLPSIDKAKPDVFQKINGNSFAHKVNLKFDTSIEGAAQEKSINDYNTFSLDLYIDALTAMKNMAQVYNDNLAYLTRVVRETEDLKELMINDVNSQEIILRIENLESSYLANQALFDNTSNVMGMIEQLYAMYNNIINNNTELTINYNFDPMVLNSMVILNQQYNWKGSQEENMGDIINMTGPKILRLVKYTNYFRHQVYTGTPVSPVDISLSANVDVYINDADYPWENGQSFDVVFATRIQTGSFSIRIFTDALNRTSAGSAYSVLVATLDSSYFNTDNDYRPFVRITCVDKTNLTFVTDKIR